MPFKKDYKVSIIVPVYKAERYINKCVNSILSQTYTNFELLLIEDGSPDKSAKICDELRMKDNRIRVFHKSNGGASSARNVGLDNITGDFVMFVDADDYIDSDMLECLVREQQRFDVDAVVSVYRVVRNFTTDAGHNRKLVDSWGALSLMFLWQTDTGPWGKLIAANRIGKHRFPEGITNEDVVFLFYVYQDCESVLFLNESYYHYRVNLTSVTHGDMRPVFDALSNAEMMKAEVRRLNFPEYVKADYQMYYDRMKLQMAQSFLRRGTKEEYPQEYRAVRKYVLSIFWRIMFGLRFPFKDRVKLLRVLLSII